MKIGIHTWGAEGDIRPYLALAGGLSEAGHDVTVAYTSVDNKDYTPLAKAMHGQSIHVYKEFPPDFEDWLWNLVQSHHVLKQIVSLLKRLYEPAIEAMYEASLDLCLDNDMVISHVIDHTLVAAAEKLDCPRATVVLCPTTLISKYIPPLGIPNFGTWINSLLWKMSDRTVMTHCFPSANILRTSVGLPPVTSYNMTFGHMHNSRIFKLDQCKVISMPLHIYNFHMIDNLKSLF